MRAFVLGAAVLLASSSIAFAADDVMASFYGNTTISKGSNGSEVHMHYKADHTFDGTGSMMGQSMALTGTWNIDDKGQLCRNYNPALPMGPANPVCTPIAAHKIGDTWSVMDRTITLVPGIQ